MLTSLSLSLTVEFFFAASTIKSELHCDLSVLYMQTGSRMCEWTMNCWTALWPQPSYYYMQPDRKQCYVFKVPAWIEFIRQYSRWRRSLIYPGVIFKALIWLVEISMAYIRNTSYPALNPNLTLALTPSEVWERVIARPIKLLRYCSAASHVEVVLHVDTMHNFTWQQGPWWNPWSGIPKLASSCHTLRRNPWSGIPKVASSRHTSPKGLSLKWHPLVTP